MKWKSEFLLLLTILWGVFPLSAQTAQQAYVPAFNLVDQNSVMQESTKGTDSEEVAPAVLRARVRNGKVVKGGEGEGGGGGGDLVIQRIDPPVFSAAELAAMRPAPVREVTEQEKSSRLAALNEARAKAPLETRLFSPNIVEYPGLISKISWWSVDSRRNFENHEVWVSGADMSLLPAVGDLNVGRRRWLLTAIARQSSAKFVPRQQPPAAAEFAAKARDASGLVVLIENGGEDSAALEPLTALLAELKNNASQLTQTMAAMKAEQRRQAERAAQSHAPVQDTVIKFWPVQSTQYPTATNIAEDGNSK